MATKREIETSMRQAFAETDTLKTDLSTRVSQINKERDDYVNSQTLAVVTEAYLNSHFRDYSTYGGGRTRFVEQELSLEQKLDILTEYNINKQILEGNNGIEVKLDDIAKRKKDAKEQFKEEALELVDMYQQTLDENKSRIALIEQDIATIKKQIEAAENKLQEIMAKDDESVAYAGRVSGKFNKAQAIADTRAQITSLEGKLKDKEKELEGLRQVQKKWEAEFRTRKTEIETFLKAQNIYAYDRKKDGGKSEENVDDKIDDKASKEGKGEDGDASTKPKDIARSMFRDFMDASPERQRKLLRQSGNEDILKMTRRLGTVDRKRLQVTLNKRMDELAHDSIQFTANDGSIVTVTKEEMRSMRDMDKAKLKAMREELDRFNGEFAQKTIDEIDEFEEKLDYIRIGSLLHETTGAFKGIRRFFAGLSNTSNSNSIYELAKSSARYATLKGERITKKEAMLDRLRAKVSRTPMDEYTKSAARPLDRTGADEFNR